MLFKLVIVNAAFCSLPDFNSSAAEVQRDERGRVCSIVLSLNGDYWLRIPSVASFHFQKDVQDIKAFPENGVNPGLLENVYQRLVLPMALQALGLEVLHASAIMTGTTVFAFCATSGMGKSTCAAALRRRGYRIWADDAVPFRIDQSQVNVLPLPFQSRLYPETIQFLSKTEKQPPLRRNSDEPVPLGGVFILNRDNSHFKTEISPVTSGESVTKLLKHSWCFSLNDIKRKRTMIENYLALAAAVPILELRYPSGLEHLSSVLDSIEEVLKQSN